MPFVYIGRTHTQVGKSLWEIIACLKNFGVGRMVIRNKFQRYAEPCFLRIVSAKPQMDPDLREGEAFCEEIFRGISKGIADYSGVGYKTDFQLIPRHEEAKYIKAYEAFELKEKDIRIYPQTIEMPPLLKLVAERKGHSSTVFKMSLVNQGPRAHIAKDGEMPNVTISPSLGTPASPEFYEGVLEKYKQLKVVKKAEE